MTIQDFWDAAVSSVVEDRLARIGLVKIVLYEKIPARCVLSNADVKFWKSQMRTLSAHTAPSQVVVQHFPSNGEKAIYLTSRQAKKRKFEEIAQRIDKFHMKEVLKDQIWCQNIFHEYCIEFGNMFDVVARYDWNHTIHKRKYIVKVESMDVFRGICQSHFTAR